MQPDVGGMWRQEILRRMREAQLTEEAERRRLRRRSPPAARTETTRTPAEIDVRDTAEDETAEDETAEDETVAPDGLAASGNDRRTERRIKP